MGSRAQILRMMTHFVLGLTCCTAQQGLVAAAQENQSEVIAKQAGAAEAAKPGTADGSWSPALTGVRRPLYRLSHSDVLDITFSFSPQFDQTVTIQPDGFISLKGLGLLYAAGATAPELENAIRQAYAAVLHDPQVTVALREFEKPFFVAAGEVGRPGKYELRADTTVAEAVAIAGGLTSRAKHSQVVLFRRVSDEVVESHLLNLKSMLNTRRLEEDLHLRPGDLLYVPQNLISKIRQYLPASNVSMYASPTQF